MKNQKMSILAIVFALLALAVPAVGAVPNNHVPAFGQVYIMTNDPAGNHYDY